MASESGLLVHCANENLGIGICGCFLPQVCTCELCDAWDGDRIFVAARTRPAPRPTSSAVGAESRVSGDPSIAELHQGVHRFLYKVHEELVACSFQVNNLWTLPGPHRHVFPTPSSSPSHSLLARNPPRPPLPEERSKEMLRQQGPLPPPGCWATLTSARRSGHGEWEGEQRDYSYKVCRNAGRGGGT